MRGQGSKGNGKTAPPRRRNRQLAAGLAIAAAVSLLAWTLLDDDGDGGEASSPPTPGAAAIVDVEALREIASESSTPIYWVGPPSGSKLELSRPAPDRTYVRYLTGDAKADDPRPFLTVGSYGQPDPVAVLRREGKEPGGVLAKAPRGGVVYFQRKQPKSVYLAYPGVDVQIEVFAPSFEQALQLVTAGRIVPVE